VDTTQLLVTVAGFATIVWVNWYFFVAARGGPVATAGTGVGPQEIPIVVDGGYDPSSVAVERGRPVRLLFERRDKGSCTEEVVIPDFGVRRFLPTGGVTAVEFTPTHRGTFEFTCGMGMVRGKLIVK
jgi:plastocyanin domain-containing protein